MKVFVVFFGLLAAASATSPIGMEVMVRASAAFNTAGLVNVPRITMQTLVTSIGLVDVYADPQLNCFVFGGVMYNRATETFVSITPVGLDQHFELQIEGTFLTSDLEVPADITLELLGIPLGLGDCIVAFTDVVVTLDVWGSYAIGNPSSAVISTLDLSLTSGGGSLTTVNGGSLVVSVMALLGADYVTLLEGAVEAKLLDVLEAGLL